MPGHSGQMLLLPLFTVLKKETRQFLSARKEKALKVEN